MQLPFGPSALALSGALLLGGVHLLSPALQRLPPRGQEAVGSFSGGVGLTYVLLYLVVELARGSGKIHDLAALGPDPLATTFLLLLTAVVVAYLLYHVVARTPSTRDDHDVLGAFFVAYNAVAGAGLVEEARWGGPNLFLYASALGLHVLFNDHHLHHLAPAAHTGAWRAALALAPLAGCGLTLLLGPPEAVLYLLLALVAGATIVSVMREELPDPGSLDVSAFLAGVVAYAALLAATWRF